MGQALERSHARTYAKVLLTATRRTARHTLTCTAIALKLWSEEQGRLPAELDMLVHAGLLPGLPIDPFAGQPLRYRPRDGLLYCVDPDRVDRGDDPRGPAAKVSLAWIVRA